MSWRFWQPTLQREIDDELEFHLEMRTRELVSRGVPAEQARREAEQRLGDSSRLRRALRREGRERDRSMRRTEWLAELRQDLGYGFRSLARNPGFTAIALLTLGVGIGATTAIFSAVNAVILRPLAVPDVDRVMLVAELYEGRPADVSVGNFMDWQAANQARPAFAALGAINWRNFTLAGEQPERVFGAAVSAEYFEVMGVAPLRGRVFTREEDHPGGARVVVLGHRLWQRRFGADPGAIGRVIILNGLPHTVLGVMPASFDFSNGTEDLWIPAAFTPAQRAQHDEHYLTVYGRLRAGSSPEAARALLVEVQRVLNQRYPDANGSRSVHVEPMMRQFVGDARGQLLVILGAVVLVLLIACANVANLLLARGATRAREFAIRASIGAGRARLVRQLLAESGALALAASVVGMAVAWVVIRTLIAAAPPGVPRIEQARLDVATLGFAVLLALASTLLFGLAPAIRTARSDLIGALRTGQARAMGSRHDWFRQGLVTTEVALALVLLVGAGLLVRTAVHLQRLDPGFAARGLVTGRIALPAEGYPSPESARRAFEAILENLAAAPGVRSAALSTQVPMGPGGGSNGLVPEGKTPGPESAVDARMRLVSPGYVAAMGIPLRRGRDLSADDRAGMPRAMLVNEALARVLFPGADPIGKRVLCCEGAENDPRWKTIVGVVGDTRSQGPDQDVMPEFFLPIAQAPDAAWTWISRTMSVIARADGEALALAPAMREALHRVDPSLPVYRIETLEASLSRALGPARFRTVLLGSLAGIGLLLALVGVYGVIAYLVTRRRPEIGVRMALGASSRDVLRMVLGQGLRPVLLGTLLGALGALAATRLLAAWLRGVSPGDPLTFAAVALTLVGVAALASLVPARRATKVSALEAMRTE
ncbi:MAG TPA: ABC transporter permease [Gemmatimonadales bacterium]|jgi:putative ABC transport system permease protein